MRFTIRRAHARDDLLNMEKEMVKLLVKSKALVIDIEPEVEGKLTPEAEEAMQRLEQIDIE